MVAFIHKRSFAPLLTLCPLALLAGCSFTVRDTRLPAGEISGPVTVGLGPNLPERYTNRLLALLNKTPELATTNGSLPLIVLDQPENARVQLKLTEADANSVRVIERYFAVVTPFATVVDDISLAEVEARWRNQGAAPL